MNAHSWNVAHSTNSSTPQVTSIAGIQLSTRNRWVAQGVTNAARK
jgi:hypothetical protein